MSTPHLTAIPRAVVAVAAMAALIIVIAPNFDIFPWLSYYDSKRCLQIALYAVVLVGLLASLPLRSAWLDSFDALPAIARWGLGLVLGAGVVSAMAADGPIAYGLAEVALFAGVLGTSLCTAAVLGFFPRHANAAMLGLITVAAGLYVFRFLSRYSVAATMGEPVFVDALIANFMHLRFFGQWISWTLPLIVITPMLLPARRLRYLPYIIASSWWMLLLLSGTRSTVGGIVLALIIVPLLMGRAGFKWLRLQLVSALVGLAFYTGGFALLETTHEKTGIGRLDDKTPFGRINMWRDAIEMMGDRYLLGAGPQSYAFDLTHLASHPHNAILQWLTEWGAPSVIVVLALLVWGFIAWVRFIRSHYAKSSGTDAVVAAGLTGSVITAGAHSMLSGIIVMPLSQIYLALITGWMLFLYRRTAQSAQQHSDRQLDSSLMRRPLHQHIALTICAMLTVLTLLNIVAHDVQRLDGAAERYQAEHGKIHPRFWRHGRLPVTDPP